MTYNYPIKPGLAVRTKDGAIEIWMKGKKVGLQPGEAHKMGLVLISLGRSSS